MPEITEYEPGTPAWVDVGTPDLDRAVAFYEGLFGWKADRVDDPAAGGYTMFTIDGKYVAAAGPLMSEHQPAAWSTYVSVADADATAARVIANGGTVLAEPMDVFDAGRLAVFADREGAVISVWQPNQHIGAQLVNEPNTYTWSELWSRDTVRAKEFYGEVFAWDFADMGDDGNVAYTEWKLAGRSIGGMIPMAAMIPAEVPPHWAVYFAVADTDAAVARAGELGATTLQPPTDIEPGRFAALSDPTGANFAVIKLKQDH